MADAKKCDRCNKYYDKNKNGFYSGICFLDYDRYKRRVTDLCDECITEAKLFLENKVTYNAEEKTL